MSLHNNFIDGENTFMVLHYYDVNTILRSHKNVI